MFFFLKKPLQIEEFFQRGRGFDTQKNFWIHPWSSSMLANMWTLCLRELLLETGKEVNIMNMKALQKFLKCQFKIMSTAWKQTECLSNFQVDEHSVEEVPMVLVHALVIVEVDLLSKPEQLIIFVELCLFHSLNISQDATSILIPSLLML